MNSQTIVSNIFRKKSEGMTLLELIIAMSIFAIIAVMVVYSISNIYKNQRQIQISENFYNESRYVLSRVTQLIRDNTVDYYRYFVEIGPDTTSGKCQKFNPRQLLSPQVKTNGDKCTTKDTTPQCKPTQKEDRATLGYETLFHWDTNNDGLPDKKLGGIDLNGVADPCVVSFFTTKKNWPLSGIATDQETLFLINTDRYKRYALRESQNAAGKKSLQLQTQLAVDTTKDGNPDLWAPFDENGDGDFDDAKDLLPEWDTTTNTCTIDGHLILAENSEENCYGAHDWIDISHPILDITKFSLKITPDRDPYLSFAINDVQKQPFIRILLSAQHRDITKLSFPDMLKLDLQTTASSRLYGSPQ